MIIEHIDIERFGALTDVTIDGLRPGVEVLHGTNETGKTSLLEFVRGVFFGFGSLFRRGVLDPNRPCGGRLVARAGVDARRITVERRHDGPHLDRLTAASYATEDNLPLADSLTVLDADESSATALFLRDFTGEIDERTFTAVMAFGLDELHELRTLDADGCGSRLYELASGLDRSKVALVLANLRSAIERLDSTDPDVSPLEALRQRRSAALARLAAMNAPALDAGALALELARIEADLAACEARAAAARAAEEKIRALLPLAPLHAERVRAAAALAELEATPAIHADYDAWELASKNRDHLARLARKKKLTRSRIAKELAGLPVDTVARKKRASIVAVCDERPRLERLLFRRIAHRCGTARKGAIVAQEKTGPSLQTNAGPSWQRPQKPAAQAMLRSMETSTSASATPFRRAWSATAWSIGSGPQASTAVAPAATSNSSRRSTTRPTLPLQPASARSTTVRTSMPAACQAAYWAA